MHPKSCGATTLRACLQPALQQGRRAEIGWRWVGLQRRLAIPRPSLAPPPADCSAAACLPPAVHQPLPAPGWRPPRKHHRERDARPSGGPQCSQSTCGSVWERANTERALRRGRGIRALAARGQGHGTARIRPPPRQAATRACRPRPQLHMAPRPVTGRCTQCSSARARTRPRLGPQTGCQSPRRCPGPARTCPAAPRPPAPSGPASGSAWCWVWAGA